MYRQLPDDKISFIRCLFEVNVPEAGQFFSLYYSIYPPYKGETKSNVFNFSLELEEPEESEEPKPGTKPSRRTTTSEARRSSSWSIFFLSAAFAVLIGFTVVGVVVIFMIRRMDEDSTLSMATLSNVGNNRYSVNDYCRVEEIESS